MSKPNKHSSSPAKQKPNKQKPNKHSSSPAKQKPNKQKPNKHSSSPAKQKPKNEPSTKAKKGVSPAKNAQVTSAELKPTTEIKVVARPSPSVDHGAMVTHEEFISYIENWCKAIKSGNQVPHLGIIGPFGKGKTEIIQATLTAAFGPEGEGWLYGGPTIQPANAHILLHEASLVPPGEDCLPIFFDDPLSLFDQNLGLRWLFSVLEHKKWRMASYETKEMRKNNAPAPPHVWTNSPIIFASNRVATRAGNSQVRAILDRMRLKSYDPSAINTHRYAATWFWDQEIHDSIGSYLPYNKDLSCRLYTDCWHEKMMGQDWTKLIQAECYSEEDRTGVAIRLLLDDENFPNDHQKALEMERIGKGVYGWDCRTCERVLKDLRARHRLGSVTRYTVEGKPPSTERPTEAHPLPEPARRPEEIAPRPDLDKYEPKSVEQVRQELLTDKKASGEAAKQVKTKTQAKNEKEGR
jgi:hypothetical protein